MNIQYKLNATQQQEQLEEVTLVSAHFACVKNPFDPTTNPTGNINFGTAINSTAPDAQSDWLATLGLTPHDCHYDHFGGGPKFLEYCARQLNPLTRQDHPVEHLSTSTSFLVAVENAIQYNLTLTEKKGTVYSQLDIPRVATLLNENIQTLPQVFNPSTYTQDDILVVHKIDIDLAAILKAQKTKIIIIPKTQEELKQALDQQQDNPNITVIIPVKSTQQDIPFAITFTPTKAMTKHLEGATYFSPTSTLSRHTMMNTQATLELDPDAQAPQEEPHPSRKSFKEAVSKLLARTSATRIPADHIFVQTGASSILKSMASSICGDGDEITVATPLYSGYLEDFGPTLGKINYIKSENETGKLTRAQLESLKAQSQLPKLVVICNPVNPTGDVYTKEEIQDLCAFAKENNLHMIFDELYAHCNQEGVPFTSALDFITDNSFVHVVRGFAKDFGLSGFKAGIGVTNNPDIQKVLAEDETITQVAPHTLQVLTERLEDTSAIDTFLEQNSKALSHKYELATRLLTEHNIPFRPAKAGVFIMINLRAALTEDSPEAEMQLFRRLFTEKGINCSPGQMLECEEPGWFRLCHVTEDSHLEEGIKRIGSLLPTE